MTVVRNPIALLGSEMGHQKGTATRYIQETYGRAIRPDSLDEFEGTVMSRAYSFYVPYLQQAQERDGTLIRLEDLNRVPKRRRPTRPSRASREARLRDKQARSRTKRQRRRPLPNGD